jgi:hypothetical protein
MTSRARAQDPSAQPAMLFLPGNDEFSADVRRYYYAELHRSPNKALLWELALPGAGNVYNGIWANAIVTVALSAAGASLWIAGAARDRSDLWWAGLGTFAAGRTYGVVSAPVGALLFNRALRRILHFPAGL